MPALGQQPMPAYPADATAGGTVDLEIVVDINGAVAHARVAASSDSGGVLDRTALIAVNGWRLTPAMNAGRPHAELAVARFAFTAPRSDANAGTVSVLLLPPADEPLTWDKPQSAAVLDPTPARVAMPRPVRRINPRYTPQAMRARIQGIVTVELIVLADGTVGAGRIMKPLDEGLDRAALVAARYWYFDPARVNGQAVATRAILELAFNLK